MTKRVVITGLGIVCGLGLSWQSVWQSMLAGKSAIRRWHPAGYEDFPVCYAAPVDRENFEANFAHFAELKEAMELRCRFGFAAARQALIDAKLISEQASPAAISPTGVVIGSGVPQRSEADILLALGDKGPALELLLARHHQLDPNLQYGNDHLAALIARSHNFVGPVMNVSTACAGAAHAIGTGFRMIRRGEVDCVLAGGADSVLNLMTMVALNLLGATSTSDMHHDKLCRPFDLERSGLVAGEGAGMVVLESEERALKRGATIYAEVCGFGSSLDAYKITAPHPEGSGAALAMQKALSDADILPENIDYINAHGTSTFWNDSTETKAIKTVFSNHEHYRKLVVNANKSQLGHMIAAAGAPECIATALALKFGQVPPTLNLDNPDPECDLDYVPHHTRVMSPTSLKAALSNSFGFGGLNASLALKRYPQP